MFKKMKEIAMWPITWGQFGKLTVFGCLVGSISGLIYCFATMQYFRDLVAEWCRKVLHKIMFWKRWEC